MSFSLRTISLYLYSWISGFSLNPHCTFFIQSIALIRCYFNCGLSHLCPPLDYKPQKERNTVLFTIMSPGPITVPNMDCCCFTIAKLYPTLCDPMNCSTSGSSVIYHLPELLRFISFQSVVPSNHLVLCCPLLLMLSIFPSIRVFSNESALWIRWPNHCSFSFSPSNEYLWLIPLELTGLLSLLPKGLSRVFSSTIWKL